MELKVSTEDFTKQTSNSTVRRTHCNTQRFRLEHYGIKVQDNTLLTIIINY